MRPRELICYGCKTAAGEPLRIQAFTDIEECPTCGRKFTDVAGSRCAKCQTTIPENRDMCDSCATSGATIAPEKKAVEPTRDPRKRLRKNND